MTEVSGSITSDIRAVADQLVRAARGAVISLHAKNMTTDAIAKHLSDVYGSDVSRDLYPRSRTRSSHITDQVVTQMQSRPLCRVYPVVLSMQLPQRTLGATREIAEGARGTVRQCSARPGCHTMAAPLSPESATSIIAMTRLEAGAVAPDFTLSDQTGTSVTLSAQRGSRVVLYFYPAAMTPGCTTQACDLRDRLDMLRSNGVRVLGVSGDAVAKLAKFAERDQLTFPLLSDPDHAVHRAYGVWGEKMSFGIAALGVIRSTFLIDEQGIITHALYNVKATGHAARITTLLAR